MYLQLILFIVALGVVKTSLPENCAGEHLDYTNSFLSYEQKGLDVCPYTYFREESTDFSHVVIIETYKGNTEVPDDICLGVIFNEEFILTTAKCLPAEHQKNVKLRTTTNEVIPISEVYLHPDYNLSPSDNMAENNLALVKMNTTLSFNLNLAAGCIWASEQLDKYAKVQEINYDFAKAEFMQISTICSGITKNDCLRSSLQRWCQKKSSTKVLQVRELGKYKMHPMIIGFDCTAQGEIVPVSKYLPWIREITKNTVLEYNLTDVGLGEKCFKNDGTMGVCLRLDDCPHIIQNWKTIQKTDKISMCGFEEDDALVCCSVEDMVLAPETKSILEDNVKEIENCEMLYDEFRRTPEEHQLYSQIAVIAIDDSAHCQAVLITARYLLTSAQCVYNIDAKNATVWLGMADDFDSIVQKKNIHAIFTHPKYNPMKKYYNVAVIMLEYPVIIQAFSVPACLWREKATMPTVLGAVNFDSHKKDFTVTPASPMYYSDCRRMYNPQLVPSEMCVHHISELPDCPTNEEHNSCQQPGTGLYANLYFGEEMRPVTYVVGIYSDGYLCSKNGPAIYTRVSEYYDWIKSVIYLSSQKFK